MKTRRVYIAEAENIPDSGTYVKDLDIDEPITSLDIVFKMNTGSTSCLDVELHDCVTKIEVVDGSDVLHSTTMIELQALNCYERGQFPWFEFNEGASKTVYEACHIHFGRTVGDEEVYLNPAKFRNPQLRITYNMTISATAGFATTTGYITVLAHVLTESPGSHMGFLMTKQHYAYTGVASAHEYIDMPTDHPYRLILMKALLTTLGFEDQIDKIKLHADREKFVKFNISGADLHLLNVMNYPLFTQMKSLLSADAGTALLDIYRARDWGIYCTEADTLAGISGINNEQVTHNLWDFAVPGTPTADGTAREVVFSVTGTQPHSALLVPMGDMQQIGDWWDVTQYKVVTLDILNQSGGTGAHSIVIQQLRK